MNWLRKVVWGEQTSFVEVNGTFYDLYNGQWRCLFNDCSALISKQSAFHYAITVKRIVEEGQEVDPSEAASYETDITEKMHLARQGEGPLGQTAYRWKTGESEDHLFLFEFDGKASEEMIDLFESSLCKALWENSYGAPANDVSDSELKALCPKAGPLPGSTPTQKRIYPDINTLRNSNPSTPYAPASAQSTPSGVLSATATPQTGQPLPLNLSDPRSPITQQPALPYTAATPQGVLSPFTPASATPQARTPAGQPSTALDPLSPYTPPRELFPEPVRITPVVPSQEIEGDEELEVKADLFLFEEATQTFYLHSEGVKVAIHKLARFSYMLYVIKSGEVIVAHPISAELNLHFDAENKSILWTKEDANGVWTWSTKFLNEDDDTELKDKLAKCLYEHGTKQPFSKVAKGDVDWILGGYRDDLDRSVDDSYDDIDALATDFDKLDFEDRRDEEEERESEKEEEELVSEEGESDGDEFDPEPGAKNSALAVGYKYDRSFVLRGSKIGVFAHTPAKGLKHTATINAIKTPSGKVFAPKKMMLHQEDEALLLLNPDERNKIYKMDLERGAIVEEWETTHNANRLIAESKYSQMTPSRTVVGLTSNGFYKVDPRLAGKKQVSTQTFMHNQNKHYNCAATTESGQLVIGSGTGQLNLYGANTFQKSHSAMDAGPRAKTALPGFGDPIKGVDVTADGKWVLATCKTYLLVVPTKIDDTTGFEKAMGQRKPMPRRLQLKTEHIRQMGGEISFTPAYFNVGQDTERSIVTSTGPYVITWNFRRVKQNILDEYQIKKYADTVVADQFKFGEDSTVIVAMPDDVTMARKTVVKEFGN